MTERDTSTRRPLIATSIEEAYAEASPDGRFVLWVSDGTLYAARYPDLTGRVQLAVRASSPHWSSGSGEIVYAQDARLFALPYRTGGDGLKAGTPIPLFPIPRGPMDLRYSVSNDGRRFLMLQNDPSRETAEEIRVIDDGFGVIRGGDERTQTSRR